MKYWYYVQDEQYAHQFEPRISYNQQVYWEAPCGRTVSNTVRLILLQHGTPIAKCEHCLLADSH